MRRNPKAELQRHRRWTQHTRGWANYPYRGSFYRYMQRYFNRKERRRNRHYDPDSPLGNSWRQWATMDRDRCKV